MGRRFLPALRGLSESKALDVVVEEKTLTLSGWSSVTDFGIQRGGNNIYGTEGRADGWDMDAVVTEGFERDVWVYRCVELISGHGASLPFQAGRNVGTDSEERLVSHPLYRVLNRRANPLEKGKPFKKRLFAQLLLSKRGVFVEVIKSRAGTIVRLDLLDPQRVQPIPDEHGDYIKHFEFTRRDGVVREIDPSRIRWIRHPHPTDPFSGTTPLEAAGMSVELDFLSRLYNVSFIKNDSRPGGILGVDTDSLSDQEMDRLERKFRPGAHHAGELTVVGTGPGGMNYVDSTTKPRDMAYEQASANSKAEVLAAFGIGESLLGNAAGRTYDNAESELYNFWTQVMPQHLDIVSDAFEEDLGDEWDPFFDTSGIEVLELPRRRDREEARNEYSVGLRSIDEYRPLAGLKALNTAQSRALWVSPAKAPIPGQAGDEQALGLGGDPGMGGDPSMGGAPGDGSAPGGGGTAAEAVAEAQAAGAEGGDLAPEGAAESAVEDSQVGQDSPAGAAAAAVDEARQEMPADNTPGDAAAVIEEAKQRILEGKAAPQPDLNVEVDQKQVDVLAATVTAAVEAELARQVNVVAARLESPKTRKGTKFWTPENETDTRGGDADLDADKVTDAARWQQETLDTLSPVVQQGAQDAAAQMLAALTAAGIVTAGATATAGMVQAPAVMASLLATAGVRDLVDQVADVIRRSAREAASIAEVVTAVRGFYEEHAHGVAVWAGQSAAYAAINGARETVAHALRPAAGAPQTPILRVWRTVGDSKVRPEHAKVNGHVKALDEPFLMSGIPVRFPHDPLAPPALRQNCRCHLAYRFPASARLTLPTS